jgi:hypothetical protein
MAVAGSSAAFFTLGLRGGAEDTARLRNATASRIRSQKPNSTLLALRNAAASSPEGHGGVVAKRRSRPRGGPGGLALPGQLRRVQASQFGALDRRVERAFSTAGESNY